MSQETKKLAVELVESIHNTMTLNRAGDKETLLRWLSVAEELQDLAYAFDNHGVKGITQDIHDILVSGKEGSFVNSIKRYREVNSCLLKEAKDAVEAYRAKIR